MLNGILGLGNGRSINLLAPSPGDVDLPTIAGALSKICRRGGHCPAFYSVAEHCIHSVRLVREDGLGKDVQSAVFLHDAAEAYIGDVVTPVKVLLPDYGPIEHGILQAVAERFGVSFDHDAIAYYDGLMMAIEHDTFDGRIPARLVPLCYWTPQDAEREFLKLASELLPHEAVPGIE